MPKDPPSSPNRPDEGRSAVQLSLALDRKAPARVQLPLPFGAPPPEMSREALFVSPANRDAVAVIDSWPRWSHSVAALVGPPGAGKTHLARVWQSRAGAEEIAPATLRDGPQIAPGPILIELAACAFPLSGDAERALFHRINRALAGGGDLLLTAERPPAAWPIRLPDLRSRLEAVTLAALGLPDDDLLGAVLLKLFIERQLKIGPDIVPFLVNRMERSLAAAARLVAALDRRALEQGTAITGALVREVLMAREPTEEER